MQEQNFDENKQQGSFDLEERLSAYYGPPLREQPLSTSSWQNLRLQLSAQENTGRRRHFRWPLLQKRARADVPTSFQDAFAHIAYEARMPYKPAMLRCRMTSQVHGPVVHASWLGRPTIRISLPVNAVMTMGQTERDVLLATGLARCIYTRKPRYMFGRLLLALVVLVASLALPLFWMYHVALIGFLTAITLWACAAWSLHIQARSAAFRADTLMVLWLGRERVCSGLHAWADRSRTPGRRRWGEPSLIERIERVCGARVEAREDQLTLVS